MSKVPNVRAVVRTVHGKGDRRYAVAYPKKQISAEIHPGVSITFSITSAWDGHHDPQPGQVVDLEDLELFEHGWRARVALPIEPQH